VGVHAERTRPSDLGLPNLAILANSPKAQHVQDHLTPYGERQFQAEFWNVMQVVQETNDWTALGDFIRVWHRTALLCVDPDYSENLERVRQRPRKHPGEGKTLDDIRAEFSAP
jgi:Family of unknown function (DUF6247)